ncbi:MAG: hypothetical protein O2816_06610 [Planctomycetota bacterium]|nr:hypothetical protein [Planctomycetota bacterium]
MNIAIALSWRRVRRGIWISLPALFVAGAYCDPMKLALLDSGLAVPASIFTLWLASALFAEDDSREEEAWLRGCPIHPTRVLAARAGFGLALLVGILGVQMGLMHLGVSRAFRSALWTNEVYPLPPGDPLLLFGWLCAIYGGTAWFAKSLGRGQAATTAGWIAWLTVNLLAATPLLLGLDATGWFTPALYALGILGILGGARCAGRRGVLASSPAQWMLGTQRRSDWPTTVPAQLAFVALPLVVLALVLARSTLFPWLGPVGRTAVLALLVPGLLLQPIAYAQASHRRLSPARRGLLHLAALSVVGWCAWVLVRRFEVADTRLGILRLPQRLEGRLLVLLVPMALFWLGADWLRPIQQWRIQLHAPDEGAPTDEAEIWLDGELVGVGAAEGWRFAAVVGDFYPGQVRGNLVSADFTGAASFTGADLAAALATTHALSPEQELGRSLPAGARLEIRYGGEVARLTGLHAQTMLDSGRRVTEVTVLIDSSSVEARVDPFFAAASGGRLSDEDRDAHAALGEAFWVEARRRMPPRWLGHATDMDESRWSGDGVNERRVPRLAELESLLPRIYGPVDEVASFDRAWARMTVRLQGLDPLFRSHWNEGLYWHFRATEPQLRFLAQLEGPARARLDEQLAAGDPHAALAAGLRGDRKDAQALEQHLRARLALRNRLREGLGRLDTDQVALAFGWSLLAVDRARGTAFLIDRLGQPDPTSAELLVINDDSEAVRDALDEWLEAPLAKIGRAWRLRDAQEARKLRARLLRARWGVERDFAPVDYLAQSPGFGAMVFDNP